MLLVQESAPGGCCVPGGLQKVFTPEGLSDRMAGARLGAALFAEEVRQGAECLGE
ncbi:MAG: hypothetical protein R2709_04075 [Marmoricola sp.]